MCLRERSEKLPPDAFTNGSVSFRTIKTEDDLSYAIFDCKLNGLDGDDLVFGL